MLNWDVLCHDDSRRATPAAGEAAKPVRTAQEGFFHSPKESGEGCPSHRSTLLLEDTLADFAERNTAAYTVPYAFCWARTRRAKFPMVGLDDQVCSVEKVFLDDCLLSV